MVQSRLREVWKVGRYDRLRSGPDGCRDNVTIVWVGKLHCLDQWLVTRHQAVAHRRVHEGSRSVELSRRKIRSVDTQVAEHLVQDLVSPFRLHKTRLGDPDEQVTQGAGVQDIGVVHHYETHASP